MTFQTKLGSYADKTRRIANLAQIIGQRIDAGAEVFQAASLCKADLMTAMVGEFPELQGTMGRYYAAAEGLSSELCFALEEHYRPRFAGDEIPSSSSGPPAPRIRLGCGAPPSGFYAFSWMRGWSWIWSSCWNWLRLRSRCNAPRRPAKCMNSSASDCAD
jgi:hypothetical protein